MSDFKNEFIERVEIANKIIESYIPLNMGFKSDICESMKYSLMAGGKRLRPILMMEVAKKFDFDMEEITPFMAAIEYIHTYSLVHDDLPAMDNDDYRRGKLTTHKVYGEAMGVLCGDALLNYAFEIVASSLKNSKNKDAAIESLEVLSRNAGISGMIGGQACDVANDGKELDEDTILYIYENKTSALIEAAMVIGAVLSGATDDEISDIEDAAGMIGMAFQIQDDILDIEGDEEKLGKPLHSDEKNNKYTYVSLYGIDESKNAVKNYMKDAKDILSETGKENKFLDELIDYLVTRDK